MWGTLFFSILMKEEKSVGILFFSFLTKEEKSVGYTVFLHLNEGRKECGVHCFSQGVGKTRNRKPRQPIITTKP